MSKTLYAIFDRKKGILKRSLKKGMVLSFFEAQSFNTRKHLVIAKREITVDRILEKDQGMKLTSHKAKGYTSSGGALMALMGKGTLLCSRCKKRMVADACKCGSIHCFIRYYHKGRYSRMYDENGARLTLCRGHQAAHRSQQTPRE